jgi:hypothetical protein
MLWDVVKTYKKISADGTVFFSKYHYACRMNV